MFINEFEIAKKVASDTVLMLKENFLLNAGVVSENDKDIKTVADQVAHEYIFDKLSNTGIPIVSEEDIVRSFDLNERQWIIDPIDGTFNFSKGFEMSAVSIALWDNGNPIMGVVHHLFSNEVFTSLQHHGSWKNGYKISIGAVKQNNKAILATGFPSGRDYSQESLEKFIINIQKYKKIRMLGSAALMIAYVACGYFDVYHEEDIYIWDVAAGLAILLEAGGEYSIKPGSSNIKFNVRATNNYLIDQI